MKFERGIQSAIEFEKIIHDFRTGDEIVNPLIGHRSNAIEKLNAQVREVAESYKEAFSIYFKLLRTKDPVQKQEVSTRIVNLFNELLEQSNTGLWRSSTLQMQILLATDGFYQSVEDLIPDAKARIFTQLYRGVHYKLHQHSWIELPLVMDAIRLMRKLSNDDTSQTKYSTHLCHLMELIAKTSAVDAGFLENPTDRQGSLANAIHWYDEASKLAQSVDVGWAEYFTGCASRIRKILHQMPPEPLFSAPLGSSLAQSTSSQHQDNFLSTPDDLIKEYDAFSDKLNQLVADQRFHLDEEQIDKWVEKHPNSSLKEWISSTERKGKIEKSGSKTIDSAANQVGLTSLQDEFKSHFVWEVERSISALFHTWIKNGELEQDQILALLKQHYPQYDWELFQIGLVEYFGGHFVSAAHILISQFEGVTISWSRKHGIEKKIRKGDTGELYLSDLVKKSEFQQVVGQGLSDLVFWYMVNRNAPQFNIRNNVAHGFVSLRDYNWQDVGAMVIWLTMKIVSNPVRVQ